MNPRSGPHLIGCGLRSGLARIWIRLLRMIHATLVSRLFAGTQSFMPPEFLTTRQYDPRRETVWRLGIIAYYLMTGCRPYTDAEQALLRPYGTAPHLKHFSSGMLPVSLELDLFLRGRCFCVSLFAFQHELISKCYP